MKTLDPGLAEACYAAHLGQTIGAAALVGMTECVSELYRERGFFLSRAVIPAQDVRDGALRLQVIEGYIGAVEVTGMEIADADAHFAGVMADRPARLSTFERKLLLLADRHGYRITQSQLLPDKADPARFTFKLTVVFDPFVVRLYGDNRGTGAQGPEQVFAALTWNAMLASGDRLTASLFTTPEETSELVYADLNYGYRWLGGALWTEVGASLSRSRDGGDPGDTRSNSDAERLYATASLSLIRSRAHSLSAGITLDIRENDSFEPVGGETSERTRVLRGTLSDGFTIDKTRVDLSLEVAHGIDGLGASPNGTPAMSRIDSRPQFTKGRLDASIVQKLIYQFDLALNAAGQIADGALAASEEFGAGGARFGRAYNYSEIIGDRGIAGALELRWTEINPFNLFPSLQLYAFGDAAHIWNEASDPTAPQSASLTSAGLGLRLSPLPGVLASVEWAKPLSRDVAEQGDRDGRVFVSLSAGL
jgi:hemolysin activation/secretion protein